MTLGARARRYRMLKRIGRCTHCGTAPPQEDDLRCARCHTYLNGWKRARYLRTRRPTPRKCGRCGVQGHTRTICKRVT